MSDLERRLAEIETGLSINHSLLGAALNPEAASAVKARIDELQEQRTEVLLMIEGAA